MNLITTVVTLDLRSSSPSPKKLTLLLGSQGALVLGLEQLPVPVPMAHTIRDSDLQ